MDSHKRVRRGETKGGSLPNRREREKQKKNNLKMKTGSAMMRWLPVRSDIWIQLFKV